jgi:hypothetical protein
MASKGALSIKNGCNKPVRQVIGITEPAGRVHASLCLLDARRWQGDKSLKKGHHCSFGRVWIVARQRTPGFFERARVEPPSGTNPSLP